MIQESAILHQGPMAGARQVRVSFSIQPKDYDILIGENLLASAGGAIVEKLGRRSCVIVTDKNVAPLYLEPLERSLRAADLGVLPSIVIEPGEGAKSLIGIHELMAALFERRIDRGTLLIALGGGVVGDLAGFAAAIALRGIDFVQIPTTLLAQVDSSVGGKTGINSLFGKNTVGAFHQPRLVLADVTTLETLPKRELLSGYAEVVKYGLIMDVGFYGWCEAHGGALLDGDRAARIHAVTQSCAYKADIVAQDEREGGVRALLNLGHTFAHPLESVTGYGEALLHGEAVALGCVLAFRFSEEQGLCPAGEAQRIEAHLASVGMSLRPPQMDYNIDQIMDLMTQDKKAREGKITLILARAIGDSFVKKDASVAQLRALWKSYLG